MAYNNIVNVPLVIELFHRHPASVKNNHERNNSERIMHEVDQSVSLNPYHQRANPRFAAYFKAVAPYRPVKSHGQALVAGNMASANQC